MKNPALIAICVLLQGCASPSDEVSYKDPVSGQSQEMLRTTLNGWEAHQFRAAPEGFLTLAKAGKPLVSVMRAGSGQDVSVHGQGSEVVATVRTEYDRSVLSEIEFSADGNLHRVHKQGGKWVISSYGR